MELTAIRQKKGAERKGPTERVQLERTDGLLPGERSRKSGSKRKEPTERSLMEEVKRMEPKKWNQ